MTVPTTRMISDLRYFPLLQWLMCTLQFSIEIENLYEKLRIIFKLIAMEISLDLEFLSLFL